jgi:ubiquinone/menaquinone biosynthesis C-methylase UbiE
VQAIQRQGDDQAKLWNGSAGCAWVEAQALVDRTLQPFEDLLVEEVGASGARRVLDVGCGTGSTTRAVARLLGTDGQSVGIDISEQMIDAARMLAEQDHSPATFICADAQAHQFEPDSFDLIIARFGTMFFTDPVAAFANLRRAGGQGIQLCSITWRSPEENPFMTAAERAAAPLLPNLQMRRADTAGPFGFADARRAHAVLEEAGWREIDIRPIDVVCKLPEQELIR